MKPTTRFSFFKQEVAKQLQQMDINLVVALKIIRDNPSLIAKNTYREIEKRKVSIRSFHLLEKDHLKEIIDDIKQENKLHLPNTYPPSYQTVQTIESLLEGIVMENVVYLRSSLPPEQLALTLIHEMNHFLNSDLHRKEKKFKNHTLVEYCNEVRAFLAEKSFVLEGEPLNESHIAEAHQMVHSLYPELIIPNLTDESLGYLRSSYE